MKRFMFSIAVVAGIAGIAGIGGCNKPTEDDCRAAITHMQELMHTEPTSPGSESDSQVRLCRGGSTREAVACARTAKTVDDLNACDFWKTKKPK